MMSWRIFERWFNAAPQANHGYITDKYGKKFWVYWDAERFEWVADLHVIYRGRWVGLLNSVRDKDGSITLTDMMVLEGNKLRKRGLGKSMLQEFMHWAQANGFQSIRGFIEPHDGSTLEYLTEWYKRQGFRVRNGEIIFELQGKTA
jgi:hypothetical protein